MKTKIFAYKNNLGAITDMENGVFLNRPLDPGQLGCVVPSTEVEITREAVSLIRNAHRSGGSFADIMLTRHAVGTGSSIGLIGCGLHHFGSDFEISRTCDLSVLDDMTITEDEAPESYREFIDSN
jgi:hypothetical protein